MLTYVTMMFNFCNNFMSFFHNWSTTSGSIFYIDISRTNIYHSFIDNLSTSL